MSKLCIPEEVLEQHAVVLGKTGSGKSSALRHIVENLLRRHKRVCIVDPKGDWWGIKSSADGKGAGFPVVAFGDFKEPKASDVPINERSGKEVAALIASGNRPSVIGFRGWMPGKRTKFWIDFASTLFNADSGELYLVGDEFHNFAPKGKTLDPEAGLSLHWSNRLMSEGRGLGLICLIASQRPQKVHNDTLTSCETLIAMRVIHAADREAVKEWIDGCGDKAQGATVLNSLAGLARGEAYVWSPEAGFGPELVKFPMFETFDSFAPPQLQKKVSQQGWADVDLDAVKEKLAAVIQEAKANDPVELKKEIARLKKELATAQLNIRTEPIEIEKRVEVPVLDTPTVNTIKSLTDTMTTLTQKLDGVIARKDREFVTHMLQHGKSGKGTIQQSHSSVGSRGAIAIRKVPMRNGTQSESLPKGEMAILSAIAQFNAQGEVTREQLTVLTGYKRSSRDTYLQRLKEKGYIQEGSNGLAAMDAGIEALGADFRPLPTGKALQEHWLQRLPQGERAVLEILIAAYPESVDREVISDSTGYQRSSRDTYIQRLSARMLVDTSVAGSVKASPILFD